MTFTLITRKEARRQGLKHYFTGKPCRNGHLDARLTSSRACCTCSREKLQNRRAKEKAENPRFCQLCSELLPQGKHRFCSDSCRKKAWRSEHDELANPVRRIAHQYRVRLSNLLAAKKTIPSSELLGCTYEQLLEHLSSQFADGMNWDNYGEWHIDHIRPCASFDLLDPEQQRQCFHYTNLQPLWATDNLRKGASYDI